MKNKIMPVNILNKILKYWPCDIIDLPYIYISLCIYDVFYFEGKSTMSWWPGSVMPRYTRRRNEVRSGIKCALEFGLCA